MAERVMLVCDVCGQPAETSVTFRVGNRSLSQDLCSTHLQELIRHSHTPRRGRRPKAASASPAPKRTRRRRAPAAAAKAAGAAKATAGAAKRSTAKRSGAKRSATKSRVRRITDPATLEKRRAALEKARRALAEKRAAARAAS